MRITLILFMLATKLVLGQTIEQKAIDYLVDNLKNLTIKHQSGHFIFNKDSNSVWYWSKIMGDKKAGKIKLKKGIRSSPNLFYKTIHDTKDIFITTYASEKNNEGYFVKFDIVTNYDNHTLCTVYFDTKLNPINLQQDKN